MRQTRCGLLRFSRIKSAYFRSVLQELTLLRLINLTVPTLPKSTLGGPRYGPSGIAIDSAGNVFVTETLASSIAEYNQTSQQFVGAWKLAPGSQPVGIAVDDSSGKIWFTNHASSQFGFVDQGSGLIDGFATSLFAYNYTDTSSVYVDSLPYWIQLSSNGLIWFNEHVGDKISRFDPSTGVLTEFLIPTAQSSPLRFALNDQTGQVWFTEFVGDNLGELDQNETSGFSLTVTPGVITLGARTTNLTFSVLPPPESSSFTEPLVSGTLESDGNITGNLTVSIRQINSSAWEVSLSRTNFITPGNFSLTFCTSNESVLRQCTEALLGVPSGQPNASIPIVDYALVVILVGGGLLALSLVYMKRWRGTQKP